MASSSVPDQSLPAFETLAKIVFDRTTTICDQSPRVRGPSILLLSVEFVQHRIEPDQMFQPPLAIWLSFLDFQYVVQPFEKLYPLVVGELREIFQFPAHRRQVLGAGQVQQSPVGLALFD